MKRVYKYELKLEDNQILKLPKGARILDVRTQGDSENPFLWALVDPDEKETEEVVLLIRGTGHDIEMGDMDLVHISSYRMYGGSLVYHVFVAC